MQTQDSATPLAVSKSLTHPTEFFTCNAAGQMLFAVQGGIEAEDAMSWASSNLNAAIEILENDEHLSESAHGAVMLVRMAKALINAL